MRQNGGNEMTGSLVSLMPAVVDELLNDCQNDQYSTNYCESDRNLIYVIPALLIQGTPKQSNNDQDAQILLSTKKKRFWTYLLTKKCFFFSNILFGLTLATLIIVVIIGMKYIDNLRGRLRDGQDQSATQLAYFVSQSDAVIQRLNQTLIELQTQTGTRNR